MMKYKLFVLLLLSASFVFPAKVGPLPEVMRPDNITVDGNEIYVVEGAEISVYSLKNLSFIRKFGKKGEGPGELQVIPNIYYNRVVVTPGYILAESFNKVIFFSKEGKSIKEKRKIGQITKTVPIGENFVVKKFIIDENTITYSVIALYNPEMEMIKELYRQEFVQQRTSGGVKLNMVMDFIDFKVYDDKIFIEESVQGFIIEVFDGKGEKLYRIEKEYEKLKVTGEHKEKIILRFKTDPSIKEQGKALGGWNELKKLFTMKFSGTFPAIRSLEVSGGKLYVQTFKVVENKDEYVIMDLKGKIIKRVYVDAFENVPLTGELLGAKLHTLQKGKLYYLVENEDEEEWELMVEDIK